MLDVFDGSVREYQPPTSRGWYSYAARFRGEGTAARRAWRGTYVRRIVVGDLMCAATAGLSGYLEDVADVGGSGPACRCGSGAGPAEAAAACRRRSLPRRRG